MRIGLALSGGGTRAAVFHLGVLLRLAHANLLEKVDTISSVSGGSLATALVIAHKNIAWPSSNEYKEQTYPRLRKLLTEVDLFSFRVVASHPSQWSRVFQSRADIVAEFLERRWGISGELRDLPESPKWLINTTCIESGKNWRFSKYEMGDWKFGRHFVPEFSVAKVAAASAAVPYVLGALSFVLPKEGWYDTNPASGNPRSRKEPPLEQVSLWDGGVYENLGIEPLYKPGRGLIDCSDLLISDASGAVESFSETSVAGAILSGTLPSPRLFDITSDQIRGLRSRMFVEALMAKKVNGAIFRIGNSVRDIDIKAGRRRSAVEYSKFQSERDVTRARKYPTSLSALAESDFDLIARHAFECTDSTLRAYRPDIAAENIPWEFRD